MKKITFYFFIAAFIFLNSCAPIPKGYNAVSGSNDIYVKYDKLAASNFYNHKLFFERYVEYKKPLEIYISERDGNAQIRISLMTSHDVPIKYDQVLLYDGEGNQLVMDISGPNKVYKTTIEGYHIELGDYGVSEKEIYTLYKIFRDEIATPTVRFMGNRHYDVSLDNKNVEAVRQMLRFYKKKRATLGKELDETKLDF